MHYKASEIEKAISAVVQQRAKMTRAYGYSEQQRVLKLAAEYEKWFPELSTRTKAILISVGIRAGRLPEWSEKELSEIPDIGEKRLNEIRTVLFGSGCWRLLALPPEKGLQTWAISMLESLGCKILR